VNIDNTSAKFRYDINALRALAVLLVVLYHFKVKGFGVGFIGVDIFFVLSGFLMTQIIINSLEANRFSYLTFIYSRIARIWPALIALVLVLSCLGAFLLPPSDYENLANGAMRALFFISNIEFAKGLGYFSAGLEERWFLHSWSLSVEWQFYCIYPVLLYVLFGNANKIKQKYALNWDIKQAINLSLLFLTLLSLLLSQALTSSEQPKAFFSLPTRAWEMLIGGHVFISMNTPLATLAKRYAGSIKLLSAMMFASCVWLGRGGVWESSWPGLLALIPVMATALYLIAGKSNTFWHKLEASPLTQALGNWSYSIYLWHWPVVIAINFYGLAHPPKYVLIAGILLSLILGYTSYRLVEQTFRKNKNNVQDLLKIIIPYSVVLGLTVWIVFNQGMMSPIQKDALRNDYTAALKLPALYENSKLAPGQSLNVLTANQSLPQKILLMGDSHAEHLYPWFISHQKNSALTFAITIGCPPVPGFNRVETGWHCDQSFQQIEALIAKSHFDVIVISGNWYAVDWLRPGICSNQSPGCPDSNVEKNRQIAISQFASFVSDLLKNSKKVIIVKPTPYANIAMGRVAKRYKIWGVTPPENYIDKEWAGQNGDRFLADVLQKIPDHGRLYFIDLRDSFCKEGVCDYFDENQQPVFWDDNHFTPAWIIRHGNALSVVE
jgi:peptidoglycan/LPS O-acetylase OafA/YrhL